MNKNLLFVLIRGNYGVMLKKDHSLTGFIQQLSCIIKEKNRRKHVAVIPFVFSMLQQQHLVTCVMFQKKKELNSQKNSGVLPGMVTIATKGFKSNAKA